MTKRELTAYLKSYRDLDKYIDQLLEERARLLSRITSATSNMDGMPHGTGGKDSMGNAVARLVDMERLIDAKIDEYADQRAGIEVMIDSLPVVERRIMHLRYVEGMEWPDVQDTVGYERSRCYDYHREAMEKLRTQSDKK